MEMCLELKLHEDPKERGLGGREAELHKHLFWTCFKLGTYIDIRIYVHSCRFCI